MRLSSLISVWVFFPLLGQTGEKTQTRAGENSPVHDLEPAKDDDEDKKEEEDGQEEDIFFGENPAAEKDIKVKLSSGLAERIKIWMTKGIEDDDKKKRLEEIPRKGDISFEAPLLNEEVLIGLNELAVKRDKFFVEY